MASNSYKPKITKFELQSGTERTLFATWTCREDYVENYQVMWQYDTGDGVWFIGNDSTTDIMQSTYSAPENAKIVKFKVKAVSEKITKTTRKGTVTSTRFVEQWSTEKKYDMSKTPPLTPSTPSIEITDGLLLTTLDNLDLNATVIQFQVVQDNTKVFKQSDTPIDYVSAADEQTRKNGYARYTCYVENGSEYKVRARSGRGNIYSEWSDFSSNVSTRPGPPTLTEECKANSETSVYLAWTEGASSDTYTIEYTTKKEYFDGSDQVSSSTGIKFTHYEITGLESGKEYFFRVQGVNDNGNSTWSNIISLVVGKKPAAPTTWSSTTTAIVGETINLYWVHNSEDGSSQTYAELELIIDGFKETRTIKNNRDEEDKDKTSIYSINTVTFYEVIENSGVYTKTTNILYTEPSTSTALEYTTTTGETVYSYIDDNGVTRYYCKKAYEYGEGAKIEWRVRTAGVTKTYGDWSIQRTIDVYAAPTLIVELTNSEGNSFDQLTSFPFYLSALPGPKTQAPIGYHVSITSTEIYETIDNIGNTKIVNKDEAIYSKYFDVSSDLLVEFSANNIDLENNVTYSVNCTVTMDSGLTAESSLTFTVAWSDIEYVPNAEIGIDKNTLSAYIKPYCEDDTGTPISGLSLSVYRREYDGTFTEIVKGVSNARRTLVVDPHPALDYARYRIVAIEDATGAVSYCDLPGYPVEETSIVIQWNESWSNYEDVNEDEPAQPIWSGSIIKLPYNVDISSTYDKEVSNIKYIGRKHPVTYYGTQLGEGGSWSGVIPKSDTETLYALYRLSVWMGDVYVRAPSGIGYWANVKVTFPRKHKDLTIPVTLDIVRVEGGM